MVLVLLSLSKEQVQVYDGFPTDFSQYLALFSPGTALTDKFILHLTDKFILASGWCRL